MARSRGTSLVVRDLEIDWTQARRLKERVDHATRNIVTAAGYALLERANETVPLEEGDLKDSGYVEVNEGNVDVGYSSPYALRQHEVPMSHSGNGRWKWLELTAQERETKDAVAKKMAKETEEAIR